VANVDLIPQGAGGHLLQLFTDNIKRTLRAKAIAAISDELDAAVSAAVESLRTEIQVQFDESRRQAGAVIITHKVTPHE
jgi:hypothetical protein